MSSSSLKAFLVLIITLGVVGLEIVLFEPYYRDNRESTSSDTRIEEEGNNTTEEQPSNNELDVSEIIDEPNGIYNEDATNTTLYRVLYVIDGDTIKIDYYGVATSVRLVGVNTPETVDPRKTVECFGIEASNYLKSVLSGKYVKLERDYSQSDRDVYDRLLRYVYLNDEDVGYKIIRNGYGQEYTYYVPHKKMNLYKMAQKEAEENERGLWSPTACF